MYTHGTIQIGSETFTYDAKHFDLPEKFLFYLLCVVI